MTQYECVLRLATAIIAAVAVVFLLQGLVSVYLSVIKQNIGCKLCVSCEQMANQDTMYLDLEKREFTKLSHYSVK